MALDMDAFSVCDCDRYLEHLAHVSVHRQMVVAAENVCNQFGVLLLRGGTPLGALATEKMRGHRLNKAVDEVLHLRRRLDSEALVAAFLELLDSEPDLRRINEHYRFEGRVRHLCHTVVWPRALLQQLSVMQHALPRVFHRALFSAWLGSLIASERRFDSAEISLVFQAGLYHDLGFLHLDPALAGKNSELSAEDWHTVQQHVPIGAAVVAHFAPDSTRLAAIVLQHHERNDGTGYPQGVTGAAIDPAASIIALSDMIHALRFPSLVISSASVADCLPFLQVNRHSYEESNYLAATRILMCARDSAATGSPSAAASAGAQNLIEANRSLISVLGILTRLTPLLEALPGNRMAEGLLQLLTQLHWVTQTSGIGDAALEPWLAQEFAELEESAGAQEMVSTMREVLWIARRIRRQLQDLAQARAGEDDAHHLASIGNELAADLQAGWQCFETVASPG